MYLSNSGFYIRVCNKLKNKQTNKQNKTLGSAYSLCESVRSSVRGQLVKILITLEPHCIFDQILHTNACHHFLTTDMCNNLFDGRRFAEH